MELLRGANLHDLGRRLREASAVPWWVPFAAAEQALAGLACAHAARGETAPGWGSSTAHRSVSARRHDLPTDRVTRGAMAPFLVATFGLAFP
jgi:hypothetical protein